MTEFQYTTIKTAAIADFTDRGSRFIAFTFPISSVAEFKIQLSKLKEEHPKAVHHCFAYRIGNDKNNFRSSDDGEPSGTAGKPILNQIDSKNLTNILVVVVRYFGGILLGVSGLINAYKTATTLALKNVEIVTKSIEKEISIECDYTQLGEVMNIVKANSLNIVSKKIELFCEIKVAIPLENFETILNKLQHLKSVSLKNIE